LRAGPTLHDEQLDGLRTFAVGGVLYAHFLAEYSLAGHQGVRLFFVLSGFLISRILIDLAQREDFRLRTALGSFYMRRVLRIAPAYLLLIIAVFSLGAVAEMGTLKWYLTYLSNFLYAIRDSWDPWVMGHTWSLSIEEQFYAVWPLIIFLTPANRLKAVCWAAIGLSLAYRGFLPITLEPSITRDILPPAAMDALGAGALLAVYRTQGTAPLGGRLGLVAAVSFAGYLVAYLSEPSGALGLWAQWAAREVLLIPVFLYVVNGAVEGFRGVVGQVLANRQMRYIGRISYGIYLFHFLVLWSVLELFPGVPAFAENGPVRFLVCGGLTVLLASVSWFVLEEPINRLKRHFPYTRRSERADLLRQA
jgi:peptidoglycan/LPS O-acetylase OafA/YrhL